ncbi:MAG TPA: MBOAT family protein [Bacteroidia bacterium]|nr:MBOAT family protein [Bacteroidia bacterium]
MVFSSSIFLTYFLPIVLLVYFLLPKKARNTFLLFASMVFYGWKAPRFIFVILATTLLDFFLVNEMWKSDVKLRRRLFLTLSVGVNLGMLVYFKYSGFFVDNINSLIGVFGGNAIKWSKVVLPIGISFYTFESITYVVDVYRKIHAPQKKFTSYLLYIIFFPKLVAGPIIRYHEIADQLEERNETNERRITGFIRFCTGLGKKVLIANYLGLTADYVYGPMDNAAAGLDPHSLTLSLSWAAALAYTFQIYFDFSGYSDMAIGLARMFGFDIPENFNQPYLSESITDFWRRWHITLGAWMKNYLYIPLGGNRSGPVRVYLNLFIVFLISGLWHGGAWNFIVWGCWHGFFLVIERLFLLKLYEKLWRPLRILVTFFIVLIGWVFFRVENIERAFRYVEALFVHGSGKNYYQGDTQTLFFFALAAFFSFFSFFGFSAKWCREWFAGGFTKTWKLSAALLTSLLLLFISMSYLTVANFNPFIYFRF